MITFPDIKEKAKKIIEKLNVWSLHYREYIVGFVVGFVIGAIVL